MSTGRIVGSILALVAAGLAVVSLVTLVAGYELVIFLISLAVSAVVIIGGILGLMDKKVGGWLALIGGIVWTVGNLLCVFAHFCTLVCVSILIFVIPFTLVYFGMIEIILTITGAILILVSRSD